MFGDDALRLALSDERQGVAAHARSSTSADWWCLSLPCHLGGEIVTENQVQCDGAKWPVSSWSGTLARSLCSSLTTTLAVGLLNEPLSSAITPGGATSTSSSNFSSLRSAASVSATVRMKSSLAASCRSRRGSMAERAGEALSLTREGRSRPSSCAVVCSSDETKLDRVRKATCSS